MLGTSHHTGPVTFPVHFRKMSWPADTASQGGGNSWQERTLLRLVQRKNVSRACHNAGTSRPTEGMYGFPTGDLSLAGEYAVTAEFTETRAELTRLLTKKTAVLRSSAATFQVLPGSWHGSRVDGPCNLYMQKDISARQSPGTAGLLAHLSVPLSSCIVV